MTVHYLIAGVCVVVALLGTEAGLRRASADDAAAQKPWSDRGQPTDVARSRVEEVGSGRHEYVVTQGGTVDGRSCRSPVGVWQGWQQSWESNRAVRIENVGESDVVNPWLSNGRNTLRTIEEIAQFPLEPGMSDREKALTLWFQEIRHRYHWQGDNSQLGDPVLVYNVYGHNTCGNDSICMAGLWNRVGLKVTPAHPQGHCISQAYFDGRWNLLDGDMHSFYLLRDNYTVANEQDVVRDHDLVKRTHCEGILTPANRGSDEWEASLFTFDGAPQGTRNASGKNTMNMTLRPGEALVYRWGHAEPIKYHGTDTPKFPDTICNGLWEYRPDLSGDLWREGAESVENVQTSADGLAADAGQTGTIVWKMASPYVFVGGRIEPDGQGAKFALSWDGNQWHDVGTDLDAQFPIKGAARHEYYVKCTLEGDARLKALGIIGDVQMAPLTMPEMVVGENKFVYTDESEGERQVRITHYWVERSTTRPPLAPAAAVFPPDGGKTDGTDFAFRWEPARDPDGDRIADYHFMLADRPDMKYPLSPNFWRLVSRTPDKGKPQYTLPYVGLLTPGTTYYWRVRAQDSSGVWGPWSRVWSFVPEGPTPPLDVTLDLDPATGIGTLTWKPNPVGRAPATYRVYGSDEKGFSVSDEPYKVNQGKVKDRLLPEPFPANFAAETPETEMPVVGVGLDLPNANKAFYRVVAVDARGKRSWSSAYAAALRPFVYTPPVTAARVGKPYSYQVGAIRSLGDARFRHSTTMAFWDVEHPRYAIESGPDWLKIDAETGLLTGTPDAPGTFEVVLSATTDREVRKVDVVAMSWGQEKVTGTATERVGSATQEFTIDVGE